jgi:crotonobetainyl-CoA:carnitine CoA-transferase CaiB-like acyl-CoA transferase
VSDAGSGLLATIGILTAIIARQKTGQGQYLDLAMLDGVLSLLTTISGFIRPTGQLAQAEYLSGGVLPGYNIYEAKEGGYLALGIYRPQSWQTLCQTLGREDFIDHQWATGEKQREIISFLEEVFRTKTRDEWCRQFRELDIEVGPVYSLPEVYDDEQVLAREMVVKIDHPLAGHMRQIGIPFKFSKTPGRIRRPAPVVGQDTEAILRDLEYDDAGIEMLRNAGAV